MGIFNQVNLLLYCFSGPNNVLGKVESGLCYNISNIEVHKIIYYYYLPLLACFFTVNVFSTHTNELLFNIDLQLLNIFVIEYSTEFSFSINRVIR